MRRWVASRLHRIADHIYPPLPPISHMEAVKTPNSYAIVFHDKHTGDMFGCCGKHDREEAN